MPETATERDDINLTGKIECRTLDPELELKVRKLARAEGVPLSDLVREKLRELAERHDRLQAHLAGSDGD